MLFPMALLIATSGVHAVFVGVWMMDYYYLGRTKEYTKPYISMTTRFSVKFTGVI